METQPRQHPAPRQTQSYLRNLFGSHRLHPKKKLGQNFLIDLNLVDFVVTAAELTRADLVLEVGSGTGSLTAQLAEHAGSVLSIEIDPAFFDLACETVQALSHVRLVNADILKNKNLINPDILAQLDELTRTYKPQQRKLVANLPYAIATPLITNLLIAGVALERMVVMVQWEIAEKLVAKPNTKEYGALAVMVQSLADVEILRRLPPDVFWPRPLVDSGIVCVRPSAEKRARVRDVQALRNFLRDVYSHRRKNLRGALISATGNQHSKDVVDRTLAELGFAGTERAETLSIEQHLQICEAFDFSLPK